MTKELEMTNIEFLEEHIEHLKEVLFDDDVPPMIDESVETELKYWESILKELKALEIVKEHKLLNYVLKNKAKKCASMYHLTDEEKSILKEAIE